MYKHQRQQAIREMRVAWSPGRLVARSPGRPSTDRREHPRGLLAGDRSGIVGGGVVGDEPAVHQIRRPGGLVVGPPP
jgi:hypothetical protein